MADEKAKQQRKQPVKLSDIVELTPPSTRRVGGYRRNHWTANIGRVEATGLTDTDAVEALRRRIEKAFEPNYSAYAMCFRGYLALVWKELESWRYQIIPIHEGEFKRINSSSSYDKKEDAIKHIHSDMAQIAWDGEEEQSPILDNEEEQNDFARWARWQKEYKRLKATGLEDNEIRNRLLGF